MLIRVFRLLSIVLFGCLPMLAEGASSLGMVASKSVTMDGITVPSGTTLVGVTVLETGVTPAAIHLRTGDVFELRRNSEVRLSAGSEAGIEVAVHSGSIVYRDLEESQTAGPDSVVVFSQGSSPQRKSGTPVASQQKGVVAILTSPVKIDEDDLVVNNNTRIKVDEPVLIQTADLTIREINCVDSVDETTFVELGEPVERHFPANALLIQGELVEEARDEGVEVVDACEIPAALWLWGSKAVWIGVAATGTGLTIFTVTRRSPQPFEPQPEEPLSPVQPQG